MNPIKIAVFLLIDLISLMQGFSKLTVPPPPQTKLRHPSLAWLLFCKEAGVPSFTTTTEESDVKNKFSQTTELIERLFKVTARSTTHFNEILQKR